MTGRLCAGRPAADAFGTRPQDALRSRGRNASCSRPLSKTTSCSGFSQARWEILDSSAKPPAAMVQSKLDPLKKAFAVIPIPSPYSWTARNYINSG
jgi:hypothetical protein